jgi:ABC-type multidrug transport system fused ATPase/permease subunit
MLFKNKTAVSSWVILIFLQQLIAAAGTWSTARAIHAIQEGNPARPWILVTLLGILFPYLPALFSRRAIKKWELLLQQDWIDHWLLQLRGRLDLYNDAHQRDSQLGILQQDGPILLTQLSTTTTEFFSLSLNFLFQWIVLTFFYSKILGLTLGAGVFLSSTLIFSLDRWAKSEAGKTAEASIQMTRLLPGAWERTVQDNPRSASIWHDRFTRAFERLREQSLRSVRATNTITGISLLVMTLPFPLVILLSPEAFLSPTMLLLLVASLPRLLQTVQSAMNATSAILNLRPLLIRLQELERKIPVHQDTKATAQKLLQRTSPALQEYAYPELELMSAPGRTTLRAPNGSGKSSILLHIKASLGNSAYYLPPHGGLPVSEAQAALPSGSTGQNMMLQLEELLKAPPAPILLLDEWDANLDAGRTKELDQKLEALARGVRIIEVRHQK